MPAVERAREPPEAEALRESEAESRRASTAAGRARDQVPPQVEIIAMPGLDGIELVGAITDAGSGAAAVQNWIDGAEAPLDYDGHTFRWQVPEVLAGAE